VYDSLTVNPNQEFIMSKEQTQSLFAIIRATVDGQITPEVAEGIAKKVCNNRPTEAPKTTASNVRLRFTGNRLSHSTPEERD
jgi:hypothetical protein